MRSSLATIIIGAVSGVSAWGELGHRTVAYLAEKYMTHDASEMVNTLLVNDEGFDISDAALWADSVRRREGYRHTGPWHYIDAEDDPPFQCNVKYSRDCDANDGCIVSAITNMTSRFLDPHLDNNDQLNFQQHKEALMFILHFIGDIHQPLHADNISRGGNDIHVCFDVPPTKTCKKADGTLKDNLHSVWDTYILHKYRGLRRSESDNDVLKPAARAWADELFTTNTDIQLRKECANVKTAEECALKWAKEANRWVCEFVLKNGAEWVEKNKDLGKGYFEEAVPVVNDMVGKAGMRLGAWLNALAVEQQSRRLVVQARERMEI